MKLATYQKPTNPNQAMLQDEHIELTSTIAQHLSDTMTKMNALEDELLKTNERLLKTNERLLKTNERLLKTNERLAELSSIFTDTVSGKGA